MTEFNMASVSYSVSTTDEIVDDPRIGAELLEQVADALRCFDSDWDSSRAVAVEIIRMVLDAKPASHR
jgi:hypothetical protein